MLLVADFIVSCLRVFVYGTPLVLILVELAIPYDGDHSRYSLVALAIPYDGNRYDMTFTVYTIC